MNNTQVKNPFRIAIHGTNKICWSDWLLSNGVSMSKDTCGYFSGFDSHRSGSQTAVKTQNNNQRCKKAEGVSLQNSVESRSKAGEENKTTMPVDVDNHAVDIFISQTAEKKSDDEILLVDTGKVVGMSNCSSKIGTTQKTSKESEEQDG